MFGMSKPPPAPRRKARADVQVASTARDREEAKEAKEDGTIEVTVSLTPAQMKKLLRLGGSAWIATQIDNAVSSSLNG
jgi:hypothetical protein